MTYSEEQYNSLLAVCRSYKNDYDNAFERLKSQQREIERLKSETAKEIYSKMYDFAYRTKSYYTDALNDIIAKIDETFSDFRIELESLLREYYVEVEE